MIFADKLCRVSNHKKFGMNFEKTIISVENMNSFKLLLESNA